MSDDSRWYDDDDFWRRMRPFMFGERRWEAAQDEIGQLAECLELDAGARILDLPCGPGRHALELARRGMDVTAVDRTAFFVDEARHKAENENLDIEFEVADMREFERPGEFDAVINLFTSFGYFEVRTRGLKNAKKCPWGEEKSASKGQI